MHNLGVSRQGDLARSGLDDPGRDWRPAVGMDVLRRRARLLAELRAFMRERGILEVETPLLSRYPGCESDLYPVSAVATFGVRVERLYLQASPESAMKRLLAAGAGPIYQLSRAFRDRERGHRHLLEFTLLEWYRPGWDHFMLMSEIAQLLGRLGLQPAVALEYREAFRVHVGLDPFTATMEQLRTEALAAGLAEPSTDRPLLQDFLFSQRLAPRLGCQRPQFLYHYPTDRAPQARVRPGHSPVAERFELFIGGVEIANGYRELTDATELERRMRAALERCQKTGGIDLPLDTRLIAAVRHGLPDCAGVALGVDRLLMALAGARDVNAVAAFPWP